MSKILISAPFIECPDCYGTGWRYEHESCDTCIGTGRYYFDRTRERERFVTKRKAHYVAMAIFTVCFFAALGFWWAMNVAADWLGR